MGGRICFLFRVIFMRVKIHPNWVCECHFETKKAVRRCCAELTPPPIFFMKERKDTEGRMRDMTEETTDTMDRRQEERKQENKVLLQVPQV